MSDLSQAKMGGVDSRFFRSDGAEIVAQCKHWARAKVADLTRALRKTELEKIKKLKPSRYILVTSLPLSRKNKEDIKSILSPYIKSESDIFGNEDLNDLLAKHSDILKRHFKLWISNTHVLERVLHAAIVGRSEDLIKEIVEKRSRYVVTSNHGEANKILKSLRVVLITGEPGAGKTTLAEQLCLEYVSAEYELCVISKAIEEAEGIFESSKKQIFYFDDFLGSNVLHALNRHEDSKIVNFIKRVRRHSNKRFILTSRTTVLHQGKRLTDKFTLENVDKNEYEIRVSSLKDIEKAQILYNHIWFSDLKISQIEEILKLKRYREVIGHQNFNPRLIQLITSSERTKSIGQNSYWEYVRSSLANPVLVWEGPYSNIIDDYGRVIVLLLVYGNDEVSERKLRSAYDRFLDKPCAKRFSGHADFDKNIQTLVGSFVNRTLDQKWGIQYSLFNPSVADYVLHKYANDASTLDAVFSALKSLSSLKFLNELIESKILEKGCAQSILENLAKDFEVFKDAGSLDIQVELIDIHLRHFYKNIPMREWACSFLLRIPEIPERFSNWSALLSSVVICINTRTFHPNVFNKLVSQIRLEELSSSEFNDLCKVRAKFPMGSFPRLDKFLRPAIVEYWEENIVDEINDRGTLADYLSEDEYDSAEETVKAVVREILSDYNLDFTEDNIDAIASKIDIYDVISDNHRRYMRETDNDRYVSYQIPKPTVESSVDPIEELFNVDLPPK